MSNSFRSVDIWVGRFASAADLDAYLDETRNDDRDEPISFFAADQNQRFYDHDFVEAEFHPTTSDFAKLIAGHSFAHSYLSPAATAFKSSGCRTANTVILAFDGTIDAPRSSERTWYSLTYLGRFECVPESPMNLNTCGDDGPPASIYLTTDGRLLKLDDMFVSTIPVDSRGLTIGRSSPNASTPVLDLSEHVDGLADIQAKIYQDRFDQWVIEDFGANSLTRIDGRLIEEKTFPWHGKRLSIGTIELQWSVR
jgi:hypothetical protein